MDTHKYLEINYNNSIPTDIEFQIYYFEIS